jgi:polysaccharide export outer membrane protein
MTRLPFLIAAIACLALSSVPGQAQLAELAQRSGAAKAAGNYVLNENDVLRMEVFQEPELATTVRILKSGEAGFPLIGSVKLAGLTVAEATDKLRALYDADYLVEPKVNLTVNEYAQQFVDVLGAVRGPGRVLIPASGKLDLAAALAAVGGLGPTADPAGIKVTRADGSSATYSLAQTQAGNAAIPLSPGDRVLVGESQFANKTITILGEVRARGELPFPIDGKLDLLTAIARAGGYTELANPKKVNVNRKGKVTPVDARDLEKDGATPYLLQPEDVIIVTERRF